MARVTPLIQVTIDPANPAHEICDVIAVVLQHHPGREEEILKHLSSAIESHRKKLKEEVTDG
jgi:hypothetical protein